MDGPHGTPIRIPTVEGGPMASRTKARRAVIALSIMTLVLAGGAYLGATSRQDRGGWEPTPHPLQGMVTTMVDEGYPLGAENATDESDLVAEVEVEAENLLRFNTPDGALPSTIGALGADWVYGPARFAVRRTLFGPETARGVWAPLWGGSRDGFAFRRNPDHAIRDGQVGLAFLREVPPGLQEEPFYMYLAALGAEMRPAEPVYQVVNWYRYEGGLAVSPADETQVPLGELLAIVEAAIAAGSG
jgi:hypothetical protein